MACLDQEERALHIDVEVAVIKGLVDLRDRRELCDAGVDEQHVDATVLGLDLIDQCHGRGHVSGIGQQHLDPGQLLLRGFDRALGWSR